MCVCILIKYLKGFGLDKLINSTFRSRSILLNYGFRDTSAGSCPSYKNIASFINSKPTTRGQMTVFEISFRISYIKRYCIAM